MSLKLKRKKRTTVPPLAGGTYLGICIGIIDLGEQYNQNFKNYADMIHRSIFGKSSVENTIKLQVIMQKMM